MAILRTCCCWKSVRNGSFASGIYTMIFYTLVVTVGAFHINPVIENKVLFAFGLIALLLSGMCVMSSALLLVGLCADNRNLLLPWLICVSTTTIMDVFLSFYFITDEHVDAYIALLFITDFVICGINVYCLLCVVSQYQEYLAGRGRPEDCLRIESPPVTRATKFHWPSFQVLNMTALDLTAAESHDVEKAAKIANRLTVPGFHDGRDTPSQSSECVTNGSCSRLINDSVKDNIFIDYTPPSCRSNIV